MSSIKALSGANPNKGLIVSLKESVVKIFNPEKVMFSFVAVVILIFSILVKLWMYYFNNQIGKKIDSSSLKAAGQDSLNDVVTTFATNENITFSGLKILTTDSFKD